MPEQRFASSKRRRAYKRSFDYEEALERYEAGETQTALARAYGVSVDGMRYGLDRARKDAERGMRRLAADEMLEALTPFKSRCPSCQGPKSVMAAVCVSCHRARGLMPTRLERVPGERSAVLADVPRGSIVKHKGQWGVLEIGAGSEQRVIDFWDGPRASVSYTDVVEVAPSVRVLVDGEEQEPELVAWAI